LEDYIHQASSLLTSGGRIIIRDHNESISILRPDIPAYKILLQHIENIQCDSGKNRHTVFEIESLIDKHPACQLEKTCDHLITSINTNDRQSFATRYMMLPKILEIPMSLKDLYKDLKIWTETPHGYVQEGLRYILIQCQK